jgi:hypothetical protein
MNRSTAVGMRGLSLLAAILLAGCAHMGPGTVRKDGFDYNQALVDNASRQLLLNLVRMRYDDSWLFLNIGSVVTQYEFRGSADITPSFRNPGGLTGGGADIGLGYYERPTVSYSPLQGPDFARDMLTPIEPEVLLLLAGSKWEIKTLFMCAVDSVNGVKNIPGSPTWLKTMDTKAFNELMEVLQALQREDAFEVLVDRKDGKLMTSLVLADNPSPEGAAAIARFREILGLSAGKRSYRVVAGMTSGGLDEIVIRTRPLLSVYLFLAQGVELPQEHVDKGRVLVARDPSGNPLEVARVTGKLFHVRAQKSDPEDAYLKVRHRDYWFYIAADDLFTRQTYAFLSTLVFLQSSARGQSPLLTLSAGP